MTSVYHHFILTENIFINEWYEKNSNYLFVINNYIKSNNLILIIQYRRKSTIIMGKNYYIIYIKS